MIKVEGLSVSYSGKEVVSNVGFEFDKGSLIGIIGPNGAGKSTMIKALLGLIPKDSGKVTVDGKPVSECKESIAYVAQRNNVDWDFPINVFDTVLMGTYPSLGVLRKPRAKEKEIAKAALLRVDMWDFRNQQIGQLSGGQQQRVFIARALAQNADIFFLDEPFVGVDAKSEKDIVDLLKEIRDEGKLVFVVNHDLSKVEDYFDDLILMNREIVDIGKVSDVFVYETMTKAYESELAMPHLLVSEVA